MYINKCTIGGNIGADPEIRIIDSNGKKTKVASLNVATTERFKKKNGEDAQRTTWHRLAAFGATANYLEQYAKKGLPIIVEGKITNRSYEKDGVERWLTEILVLKVAFLGKNTAVKGEDQPQAVVGPDYPNGGVPQVVPEGVQTGENPDDLPF